MLALAFCLLLQDEVVKESDHELSPDAVVTVRTVVGRVRLRGTDKKTARVRTVKRGRDRDAVDIKVEADKEKLTIEAKFPNRRDTEVEIEIDVDIPRTAKRMAAEIVSGSIEVHDAKGDAKFSTVSGDLQVDGLQGDLAAVTISGKVRIAGLNSAKATFTLTSGSLEGAGEVGALEATSVSGGVSFDVTPKGDAWSAKASSISGSLLLRFPPKAGARIDLKSLSGDLQCDFDLKDAKRSGRHEIDRSLLGTFGEGGGTVTAKTISGNARVGAMK